MYFLNMMFQFRKIQSNNSGVSTVEYGLISSLIGVGMIGTLSTTGTSLSDAYECVAAKVSGDLCPGMTNSLNFNGIPIEASWEWDIYDVGKEVIDGWVVDKGSAEIGKAYLYGLPPSPTNASHVLELNGNDAATVSKEFSTTIGATYTMTFNHGSRTGGNPSKQFAVKIGDTVSNFSTPSTHTWQSETITFTATSNNTKISFSGDDNTGGYGAVIDGIDFSRP